MYNFERRHCTVFSDEGVQFTTAEVFNTAAVFNDDTHRKEVLIEVLIEEGNNYKIVEVKNGDETYYEYTIYDYRNKMLVKESCFRPPIFDEIGESIIKTTISSWSGFLFLCIL